MTPDPAGSDLYKIGQKFIYLINGLMKKPMGKGSTNTEVSI